MATDPRQGHQQEQEQVTRVDESQYGERSGTAASNEATPTLVQKIFCDCGRCEYWCERRCQMEVWG